MLSCRIYTSGWNGKCILWPNLFCVFPDAFNRMLQDLVCFFWIATSAIRKNQFVLYETVHIRPGHPALNIDSAVSPCAGCLSAQGEVYRNKKSDLYFLSLGFRDWIAFGLPLERNEDIILCLYTWHCWTLVGKLHNKPSKMHQIRLICCK